MIRGQLEDGSCGGSTEAVWLWGCINPNPCLLQGCACAAQRCVGQQQHPSVFSGSVCIQHVHLTAWWREQFHVHGSAGEQMNPGSGVFFSFPATSYDCGFQSWRGKCPSLLSTWLYLHWEEWFWHPVLCSCCNTGCCKDRAQLLLLCERDRGGSLWALGGQSCALVLPGAVRG